MRKFAAVYFCSMARWQFNRGEWTKAYVFMRLLGEGRIYGASSDLTKDDSVFAKMENIIRDETNKILIFERFIEDKIAYGKTSKDGIAVVTLPEVSEYAQFLYDSVKTFAPSRVTSVMEAFSEKARVGSPVTLFYPSPTSSFTSEVMGCDKVGMQRINSQDSFLSIIAEIKKNYSLQYVGCRNETFEQNIALVDSRMSEILSTAILVCALYYGTCGSGVKEICNKVIELNPIHVKNPQIFYPIKFKDFLLASFAGMTASSVWNGRKGLFGGHIDVSGGGDMLYCRAMSDDIFENYLFENTYFNRPGRGLGKDFGYVYENNGHFYIDLNFQVRFR